MTKPRYTPPTVDAAGHHSAELLGVVIDRLQELRFVIVSGRLEAGDAEELLEVTARLLEHYKPEVPDGE